MTTIKRLWAGANKIILALSIFALPGLTMHAQQKQNNQMKEEKNFGYADVNGLHMYYEVHGSGNLPLVLIHGGGSTIETTFSILLPLLSKDHKIIAVELQAHGRTTDRDAPESFQQDADDVAALLQYLKIEKASFLGFSNGGSTTLQVAIRHPALVHKIIVIAGAYKRAGFLPGFFEGMQQATIDNMPAPLKMDFLKVTPDQKKLQNMFEKDKARMLTFADWPEESIRSIKAPALFMVSDQDVITKEHTLEMSHLVSGSQLVVLPGIHGVLIGEKCTAREGSQLPQVTTILVSEFLKD